MTLKKLFLNDIPKISQLYSQDFPDGWNEQMLISAFNNQRFLCVGAFDGDILIGVITCTLSFDDADIEGVVTHRDYRNQGVARKLFEFALNEMKISGLNKILLEVRASNAIAIALYTKYGFEKISVRKKYYPDGEDAFIFMKEL